MTPPDDSENRTEEELLGEIETLARERSRLVFDGEWLAPSEARRHRRRLRWRGFWIIVDTLALLALLLALSYYFYLLVRALSG